MSSTTHTNDPPTAKNGQVTVQGAIDPSVVVDNVNPSSTTADNVNPTLTSESAKLPDDEQALKKTWLTLLPTEQVIEILMKLDECLPKDAEVRREVWPVDLKAAVFHAAVTKIVESSANANTNANANGKPVDGKKDEVKGPPPATGTTPTPSPIPPSASAPSTTPVPPLTNTILRRSPPTSTTTYQAAASASSPAAFYTYPYASGSMAYAHSSNHQPYSYSYPSPRILPASTSSTQVFPQPPVAVSVAAPSVQEDEDDLPSYEEMLVQALTVHNDPSGTAPKQLFQWMAATYPLQANFRPSASQALQKAYKRGRFEKNSEGRYRLNPKWEGGNTSRRTTRRPQSYSKAVLNPSPSSHPPANSSQFPPQHYTWTYGQGRSGSVKSQSPAPGPTPVSGGPVAPTTTGIGKTETERTTREGEDHRSCMEAAYSILQALNITSGSSSAGVDVSGPSTSTSTVSSSTAAATVGGPAVQTDTSGVSGSQAPQPGSPSLHVTSVLQLTTVPPPSPQNRAALQGTLALLAAQLAELADVSTANSATDGDVLGANLLEGMGINLDLFAGSNSAWLGAGAGMGASVVVDGEEER